MYNNPYNRRRFIRQAGLLMLGAYAISCNDTRSSTDTEKQQAALPALQKSKLGIALVGLGSYSTGQLAPALQETQHCYLAGIVTGSTDKAGKWKDKYDIADKNIYNYENFDSIKDNPAIDIVYVVLPNALHSEYVIRAAAAGKHVICEKPMAITVEECDKMIAACEKAGKMLSIGYRLHFEPHNQHMMQLGKERKYGAVKMITARDGMGSTQGWRLDKNLAGGGPLMDVGIYCVQAARYITGREPIAVHAEEGVKTKPEIFRTVEESLTWQMEFPDHIMANCATSYSENMNLLRMDAENGWAELSPAYAYSGITGKTIDGDLQLPKVNQQALQMDDFAKAIIDKRATPVPGEMGRQDVKILQAIYKAMQTGQRIEI